MLDTKALAQATAAVVREIVPEMVKTATAPLYLRIAELEAREPTPGKDADPETVKAMVTEAVAAIELPQPKDGNDGKSVDLSEVRALVDEALAEIPAPLNGKDADPAVIRSMVDEAVAASITLDAVAPLIQRNVADAVAAIPPAKDGVGMAGAFIARDGSLMMTLTDGTVRDLGRVEGKDGIPGMGPEDLNVVLLDDSRTVRFAFVKSGAEYAFDVPFPVVLDRGVFKDGQAYAAGDAVSFGGSLWIAQKNTAAKPDGPDTGWRLAVKKGRDGRDLVKE